MPSAVIELQEYLKEGYWIYGRFYGSWKSDKYFVPIDSEESKRLDLFHKVFLVARGKPYSVPIKRQQPRIMDLGTGTGIWAIDVAENYLIRAHIMAVDLNLVQPALIPAGLVFKQYDIEESTWSPLLADCDLIHMRMLRGGIQIELWP
ncbi:uncharacterized protein F5Z01DRAFT_659794 [Emericellopsis atlantica]|uniref:Methyltransferase n=1 Tax=Emericellopsis atlantica TaxID=2614577 RepID=A0A9P7ZIW0_9HYPO|nr:uncharacterized protein F5Z01DRAFT_659794 [Emericellopsis atlantica]KAG9252909.1 hypothetical protein F5Z01DRAFT_659794 [Emericellopsis atlantica]